MQILASPVAIMAVVLAVVMLVLLGILARLYRKVGPNRALIVYGLGQPRVVTGGGAIVWPMVQRADELSLEPMLFGLAPPEDLYTQQGIAVRIEAVAQIKVKSDVESILTAGEQFFPETPDERERLIRVSMEGHLQTIIGQVRLEEIVRQPEMVAGRVRDSVASDMTKMGLEVASFTIKAAKDEDEHCASIGRPDGAVARPDAEIPDSETSREVATCQAQTMHESASARAYDGQGRISAEKER